MKAGLRIRIDDGQLGTITSMKQEGGNLIAVVQLDHPRDPETGVAAVPIPDVIEIDSRELSECDDERVDLEAAAPNKRNTRAKRRQRSQPQS